MTQNKISKSEELKSSKSELTNTINHKTVAFPDETMCLKSLVEILGVIIPKNHRIEELRTIHYQNFNLDLYTKEISKIVFTLEKNQYLIESILNDIKYITQSLHRICLTNYSYEMCQKQLNKILFEQYLIPILAIHIRHITAKSKLNLGHSINYLLNENAIQTAIQEKSKLLSALKQIGQKNVEWLKTLSSPPKDELAAFRKKYIYRLTESDFTSNLFKTNTNGNENGNFSYIYFKESILQNNQNDQHKNQLIEIFFNLEACFVLKRLQKKVDTLTGDESYFYFLLNDLTYYLNVTEENRINALSSRQHLLIDINESFLKSFREQINNLHPSPQSDSTNFKKIAYEYSSKIISWQQLILLPLGSSSGNSSVEKEYQVIVQNRLRERKSNVPLSFFTPVFYPLNNTAYTNLIFNDQFKDLMNLLNYDLCPYTQLLKHPLAIPRETTLSIQFSKSFEYSLIGIESSRGFGKPLFHYSKALDYLINNKIDDAYSEIEFAYEYIEQWPLGTLSTNICILHTGLSVYKSKGNFKHNQCNKVIMQFLKHHFVNIDFTIDGNSMLFRNNIVDYDKTASLFIIIGFNFLLNSIENSTFIDKLYINPLINLENLLQKNPEIILSNGRDYIDLINSRSKDPIRFLHSTFEADELEKNAIFYLICINNNYFGPKSSLQNSIKLLNKIISLRPTTSEI